MPLCDELARRPSGTARAEARPACAPSASARTRVKPRANPHRESAGRHSSGRASTTLGNTSALSCAKSTSTSALTASGCAPCRRRSARLRGGRRRDRRPPCRPPIRRGRFSDRRCSSADARRRVPDVSSMETGRCSARSPRSRRTRSTSRRARRRRARRGRSARASTVRESPRTRSRSGARPAKPTAPPTASRAHSVPRSAARSRSCATAVRDASARPGKVMAERVLSKARTHAERGRSARSRRSRSAATSRKTGAHRRATRRADRHFRSARSLMELRLAAGRAHDAHVREPAAVAVEKETRSNPRPARTRCRLHDAERPAIEHAARDHAVGPRRDVERVQLGAVAHVRDRLPIRRPVRVVVVMSGRRYHAFGPVGKVVRRDRLLECRGRRRTRCAGCRPPTPGRRTRRRRAR